MSAFVVIAITSVLIFLASAVGAVGGIGGGIIIKPVLDFLHFYDTGMVNFISTSAVFAMAIASIYKYLKVKTQFDKKKAIYIAVGSMIGGHTGEMLFEFLVHKVAAGSVVTAMQNELLLALLVLTVIYTNFLAKHLRFNINNVVGLFIMGVFLGVTGSFLGIGGGPINIAILIMFLSLTVKDAAIYSIIIIFFSQLSKLISMAVSGEFQGMQFHVLIPVIPLAIIGGMAGTWMNKKYTNNTIHRFFTCVTVFIICLNVLNIIFSLRR